MPPPRAFLARGLSGLLRSSQLPQPAMILPTIASARISPSHPQQQQQQPQPPTASRCFSTTPSSLYRQVNLRERKLEPIPSATAHRPDIPPYPYGERRLYKQSNTGLYGSAMIRFGNVVSGRNEIKTRRKWRPNVQHKKLWSQALGTWVRTRVTTRVLRTIDKCGGLDAYLLGTKPQRVKDLGPWGWRLRWRIMRTPSVQADFARQRKKMGLLVDNAAVSAPPAVEEPLPDGVTSAEELMAETQKKLDAEEEFDLFGDDSSSPSSSGFMHEEKKPRQNDATDRA